MLQGTGTSGLSGTLTLANATHTITATTAGTDVLTVSGKITGSGGFSKTGAGEVIISGANTNDYTGTTAVTAGTLTVSDANGLGATGATDATTVTGATLNLNSVSVGEDITLNASGTLQGSGTSGTSGVMTLAGATHTINDGGGTMTLSGKITGSGGFSKTGAGTLVISGCQHERLHRRHECDSWPVDGERHQRPRSGRSGQRNFGCQQHAAAQWRNGGRGGESNRTERAAGSARPARAAR